MSEIPNLTQEEITELMCTTSAKEWNQVCSNIKRARGGQYPPDWWPKMKLSGLMDSIMGSWDKPGSSEIRISTF